MDENVKIALRFVDEAFGGNKPELLDELLSNDFVEHNTMIGSKDGLKAGMAALHTASPDTKYTLVNAIAQGDLVCLHCRNSGTQTGPMGKFPPSGKHFEVDVMDIFRIKDGKITEHWTLPDRMGKMEALGFWPPKQS